MEGTSEQCGVVWAPEGVHQIREVWQLGEAAVYLVTLLDSVEWAVAEAEGPLQLEACLTSVIVRWADFYGVEYYVMSDREEVQELPSWAERTQWSDEVGLGGPKGGPFYLERHTWRLVMENSGCPCADVGAWERDMFSCIELLESFEGLDRGSVGSDFLDTSSVVFQEVMVDACILSSVRALLFLCKVLANGELTARVVRLYALAYRPVVQREADRRRERNVDGVEPVGLLVEVGGAACLGEGGGRAGSVLTSAEWKGKGKEELYTGRGDKEGALPPYREVAEGGESRCNTGGGSSWRVVA